MSLVALPNSIKSAATPLHIVGMTHFFCTVSMKTPSKQTATNVFSPKTKTAKTGIYKTKL